MQPRNNVALVTGSSSGIGFETSLLLARTGFHTYASIRNLEKSKNITEIASTEKLPLQVVQLDVNYDRSVKDAIDKIVAENNRIDVLVNNAGYGLFSPIEDVTLDQIKEQFETNFFGVVRVTKEVLPVMRKQRNGIIVNVSSGAGRVGIPLYSAYAATKFALEGLSESMRYELKKFNINIVIIEPGVIKTNIVENLKTAGKRSILESPYADLLERVSKGFGKMMDNSSSPPKLVAEAILNAITSKDPEIRYVVGGDAEYIMRIRKNVSDKEFENWMYESMLQEKGFVRASIVEMDQNDDDRNDHHHGATDMNILPVKQHCDTQNVKAFIKLNFQRNQQIMFLSPAASSLLLVVSLISPIAGQTSQQQYVFAQKNAIVPSSDNKTSTTTTFFPQIHNYTSSGLVPVNSWIIESKNGAVVIDAQRQLSEGKKALNEVQKINKPILGIIITHPHPDHINGAAALLNGTANVPIYSTQSTFDIMKNDTGGYIALSKQLLARNEYSDQTVLPNRIVKSGENITIDGITYNFEDLGLGEAGDMTLIYLPSQKIMFTGDIVNNRMHPFFAGAVSPESRSHISEWIKQIEYLRHNYPDAKILFPGHGQSGAPRTLLDDQLNYLNTFRSLVQQQQMQSAAAEVVGDREAANITQEGKTIIKNELQRLYPDYNPVATLPNMLDYNIDAVAKEISQEK